MTAPMTDAEIREALARAERATSGPWMTFKVVSVSGWLNGCGVDTPNGELLYRNCDAPDPNHEFIAHTRTDVPRLAADLLAARAERDEARDAALQAQLLVASYSRLQSAVVSGDREAVRTRMDELSHAQAHYGLKDPSPMEELLARAETAEARCARLEAALRPLASIAALLDGNPWPTPDPRWQIIAEASRTAARLLSPPPPHTCQIHRATSGASDCGLEPCEEAKVHRDRGASRPAKTATHEEEKVCDTCHGEPATDCGCAPEYCSLKNHACPDCGGGA